MAIQFYTIGHATRTIDEFVALLQESDISFVADVRTVPRSRTNPQYNKDVLPQMLEQFRVKYEHIATLGGLRNKCSDVPSSINAFWKNESFHNYADYAMSQSFRDGLYRLMKLGHTERCVIMCAETVWWRCHRRIIADYLLAAGKTVVHIRGPRRTELARMTDIAQMHSDGALTYPTVS